MQPTRPPRSTIRSRAPKRTARDVLGCLTATLLAAVILGPGALAADERFETPIPVAELNTELQEKSPSISLDGLELYFQSNRVFGLQVEYWVYVARRSDTSEPFGDPERIVVDCANPDISADGLTLYVARDSDPGEGLDIDLYRLQRPDRESPFGPPEPIVELNSPWKDGSPTVTADELTIYFHSDRDGNIGTDDIWMATRPSREAPFSAPMPVPNVTSDSQELTPSVTPDNRRLYFASRRPGGFGMMDIWVARRDRPEDPFGTPVSVRLLLVEPVHREGVRHLDRRPHPVPANEDRRRRRAVRDRGRL